MDEFNLRRGAFWSLLAVVGGPLSSALITAVVLRSLEPEFGSVFVRIWTLLTTAVLLFAIPIEIAAPALGYRGDAIQHLRLAFAVPTPLGLVAVITISSSYSTGDLSTILFSIFAYLAMLSWAFRRARVVSVGDFRAIAFSSVCLLVCTLIFTVGMVSIDKVSTDTALIGIGISHVVAAFCCRSKTKRRTASSPPLSKRSSAKTVGVSIFVSTASRLILSVPILMSEQKGIPAGSIVSYTQCALVLRTPFELIGAILGPTNVKIGELVSTQQFKRARDFTMKVSTATLSVTFVVSFLGLAFGERLVAVLFPDYVELGGRHVFLIGLVVGVPSAVSPLRFVAQHLDLRMVLLSSGLIAFIVSLALLVVTSEELALILPPLAGFVAFIAVLMPFALFHSSGLVGIRRD